jgi:hypothetical protein
MASKAGSSAGHGVRARVAAWWFSVSVSMRWPSGFRVHEEAVQSEFQRVVLFHVGYLRLKDGIKTWELNHVARRHVAVKHRVGQRLGGRKATTSEMWNQTHGKMSSGRLDQRLASTYVEWSRNKGIEFLMVRRCAAPASTKEVIARATCHDSHPQRQTKSDERRSSKCQAASRSALLTRLPTRARSKVRTNSFQRTSHR